MSSKKSAGLVAAVMVFGIFGAGCNDVESAEKSHLPEGSKPVVQASAESSWLNEYFGDQLVLADGSKVPVSNLKGKKVIGIYFSAHWCPPCRAFTPVLVKTFNTWQKEGKSIDIVFVSSDQNANAMANYMEEMKMPWKGLPFSSSKKQALAQKYSVRGIPTLVIIDKDGKIITKQGRVDVAAKGAAAFDAWIK